MKHRLFALALFMLFPLTAHAQTAQVTGRISDAVDAVVPGAQITLTNQANGFKRETVANSEGVYTIPLLQPGTYEITIRKDGFKPIQQSNIVLNVEQSARLDFTLQAGALTETVTITSAAPVLERETSSIGQVIENKTIVTLPLNGRNYAQLVALMPGATPNQGSRGADGISINGNRTLLPVAQRGRICQQLRHDDSRARHGGSIRFPLRSFVRNQRHDAGALQPAGPRTQHRRVFRPAG